MARVFALEKHHAEIVSKGTLFKVLKYLDCDEVTTPLLLLDGDKVRQKVQLIGSGIRQSRVFYAVKANPGRSVLELMHSMGTGFEVASDGELDVLMQIGVPVDRIISSNPIKTQRFLRRAGEVGLDYFSYDSEAEVLKMAEFVPGSHVYIRLSVPNEGSEWPLSRKFGVEPDEALRLLLLARDKGLKPVGITFHVGSQCTNPFSWATALYKARALWDQALAEGIEMSIINIGGGYPINYTRSVIGIAAIEKQVDALLQERFPGVDVYIEPGRAMVGDAGVFVSRVTGKAARADENWLYIDVGVFNGMMESVGGIRYSYVVEASEGQEKKYWTIGGPSCDSFDVMDKEVQLPEPEVGALVLVLSAGAYTVSYGSEFNGFKIPETKII